MVLVIVRTSVICATSRINRLIFLLQVTRDNEEKEEELILRKQSLAAIRYSRKCMIVSSFA